MKKEYNLKKLKVKSRGPLTKDTKVQKTIRIDLEVLNWFMQEGEKRGIPYQTLMNAAMKEAMNKSMAPTTNQDDEDRIRRIVREELSKAG